MTRIYRSAFVGALSAMLILEPLMALTMTVREGYNLRMGPSMGSEVRRQTSREETVEVVERGNSWALIRFPSGRRYWIHSSGLMEHNPYVAPDNPGDRAHASVFTAIQDNWPIRSSAGTKTPGSAIVDYVRSSTPLTLLGTERDGDGDTWYKVRYTESGRQLVGYIYSGRVRPMSDADTEACTTCATAVTPSGSGILFAQAQDIVAVTRQDSKGYTLGSAFAGACSNFINQNGLGEWGRYMVSAAQRVAPDCFYNSNVFDSVCPGYRNMTMENKNAFIALLFASIAQYESTCRTDAQVQATNDIADGLFQLEYSASFRRRAGRNALWCSAGRPVDSQSLTFQSECAVSIVEDTVCAWNASINHPDGYWQKLRNNRAITQTLMNQAQRWGLCN